MKEKIRELITSYIKSSHELIAENLDDDLEYLATIRQEEIFRYYINLNE